MKHKAILTERQTEVLAALVTQGNIKSAAYKLGISYMTFCNVLTVIKQKCNVTSTYGVIYRETKAGRLVI